MINALPPAFLAFVIFIVIGGILLDRRLSRKSSHGAEKREPEQIDYHQIDYHQMTRTGETFGERAAYHRHGELSPGEHALARAIRQNLLDKGWITERENNNP